MSCYVTHGCLHATMAELSGRNREGIVHKAEGIYYVLLHRRSVLTRIHIRLYTKANVVASDPSFMPFCYGLETHRSGDAVGGGAFGK